MVERRIETEWGWTLGKVVAASVWSVGLVDIVGAFGTEFQTAHQYWIDLPGPDPAYDVVLMAASIAYVVFGPNPKR
tara:strand:- start:943 stop:1170 length:228 start_codon:yes stop_codon:yes gene_type:complete